ncbi:hypothetical protein K3M35_05275 [Rhodococcus sp. DMU2021]|uniref:hypothetical protein n=1 Tax=Rhodococcus sp. DMU2021 TaxID=2866997 RepID=UPI001C7D95C5|nr:hypothetical protein [Rhodococcus sp. DMU2021]MBX4168078.1 hypothetical protein [Rhodococcus sp. DMU2021]
MTDVTPEMLRAVADWIFDTALPASVAHALADAARQMEREQADEQRIDELAAEAYRAAGVYLKSSTNWKNASPSAVGLYSAVIRAVLYRIEQEDAGTPTSKVCGQTRPLGDPFRCSLREGHSGAHEAWAGNSTDRKLCATWENE